MNFLESCQQFIATDSGPTQGSLDVAVLAAGLCREVGMDVEIQNESCEGLPQANVIARLGSSSEEEFLLQAPLDTIDPGSFGLWSTTDHNPYSATIRDGKIYGLGAAHGKLDFLCKLKAIERFKDKKLSRPLALVGTYGSELGAAGAIQLVRKKKIRSKLALVGGPSDLYFYHAAKGMATVEITVPFSEEERAFHKRHDEMESSSSQSKMFYGQPGDEGGGNAVLKMLRFMSQLPTGIAVLKMDGGASQNTIPSFASLEFDMFDLAGSTVSQKLANILKKTDELTKDFLEHEDPNFIPPHTTLNIGMVRTFDDHIVFSCTCYIPPSVTQKTYEGWMQGLKEECQKQDASFKITKYMQPFRTALDSPIVKSMMEVLETKKLDYIPRANPVSSEANVFNRFGMDCVFFGAGQKAEAMQIPNEFVLISELEKSTEVYASIIEKVCL